MDPARAGDAVDKELKVKLPHRLIVRLHSIKVLQGRLISETLAEALDEYYARPDVMAAMAVAHERATAADDR